jgi:transcription initiation factor TFIIB
MRRLKKWQTRTRIRGGNERSLVIALQQLNLYSDQMGLPVIVRERAAVHFRKAQGKRIVRGRSINSVLAALIYIACRQSDIVKTNKEIAAVCKVDVKMMDRCFRVLMRTFDFQLQRSPIKFLVVICSKLGVSGKIEGVAAHILKELIDKKKVAGKNPNVLAAAVLYVAGEGALTQVDIADAADVTEVSVRNNYRWIAREVNRQK